MMWNSRTVTGQNLNSFATFENLDNNMDIKRAWGSITENKRVCPKVSGLAAWSENCKWYSSATRCSFLSIL
jgi:hypothetical protein